MAKCRFVVGAVFFSLCLCLTVGPAYSWEFSMKGEYSWRYESYSQLGSNGFFGPYDVDNAAIGAGAAASVNFWHGERLAFVSDTVSGADAVAQLADLTVFPKVKFNKAVVLHGRYRIGWWDIDNPTNGVVGRSEYLNSQEGGVQRSFSPGYWELLWLTARTPIGKLKVGKRPGKTGCGLIWDGTDNYSIETLALGVPYGPLSFSISLYPMRMASRSYWNPVDKNAIRRQYLGLGLKYAAGSIQTGIANLFTRHHEGSESQLSNADRLAHVPYDRINNLGTTWFKYNNGRFSLNSELSWYNRIDRRQGAAPRYVEHWRAMTELGMFAGPAKVSLIWAWISGPDRRHGAVNDRTGLRWAPPRTTGNTSLFKPYSRILVCNYGGGNNSFTNARNGYLTDANAYGGRIDYAVAANLNLFGSFFRAERLSHGYGWGFIRPVFDAVSGNPDGQVEYELQGSLANPVPAIPDPDLGYEFDWGFDWQLLEGYTVSGAFGIWKPGKWFNYACVDRSNTGWKAPGGGNNWGVNPGREITPVFSMEIAVSGEF